MADWSKLLADLLTMIAMRISTIEDFVVFSAVCQAWRSVAMKTNWLPQHQAPWLMLAESSNESSRKFFSFYKNKSHRLELPEAQGKRVWGSPHGWICTFGLDLNIRLLNPLTRNQLDLPDIHTFKHQPDGSPPPEWFPSFFIHKSIILQMPKSSELLVVVIYGGFYYLSFAKPGDKSWTAIEPPIDSGYHDVVSFNDQIFAVHQDGTLVLVDLNNPVQPNAIDFALPPYSFDGSDKLYLVESDGNLFMILRTLDQDDDYECGYKTMDFQVYRFNFDSKDWSEINDLGDCVFFVGNSCSLSISSPEIMGCKGNRIYFTDDNHEQWNLRASGGNDMGVFEMENSCIHPHYVGDDSNSQFSCAVWVTPSIF